MSKEYKVRLLAHAGQKRRRAGLEFERGVPVTMELDAEQLKALKADSFFSVKEAGEGSDDGGSTTTPPAKPLAEKKRATLDKMAKKLGIDPKEHKNRETLAVAIEEAQAKADEAAGAETTPPADETTPPAGEGSDDGSGDDDEEEDLDLTTLSVDDLKVIATELNINTADANSATEEETKAKLIEAIEAEKAKEE